MPCCSNTDLKASSSSTSANLLKNPINRKEAKEDLGLKVTYAQGELADVMWKLYLEYESALKISEPFQPLQELDSQAAPATTALTTQQIVGQMSQLTQAGVGIGTVTEEQLVALAAAMIPFVSGGQQASNKLRLSRIAGAYVESAYDTDVFLTDLDLERVTINSPGGPQQGVKQEAIWQRWEKEN